MQSVGRRPSQAQRRSKAPVREKVSERQKIREVLEVGVDYTLFISIIFLTAIGIVMVFSASYYVAVAIQGVSRFQYVRMQFIAAVIGFVAMFIVSKFNYEYIKRMIPLFYLVSLILLGVILIPGVGSTAGGATRWLHIPGIPVGIQPSEVAKIASILMVAKMIASHPKKYMKTFGGMFQILVVIGIPVVLVGVQNLSTAIVIAAVGFAMVFVASPYVAVFVIMGVGAVAGLVGFLAFLADGFRADRFEAWLDPFAHATETGFQTVQSLFAIGSGGLFGLGLGQSRQKLGFIPEAHNDIIFSVIVEELGLLGGGIILFLFGVFLWRALKIAMETTDLFASLIATGIAVMIGVQVVINVGVVTNTIPNTGVPLPFISYGGTSLSITLASMGLLLSISRFRDKKTAFAK